MGRIGTKLFCLAMALCLLFTLASCGQGDKPEPSAGRDPTDELSTSAGQDRTNEDAPSADNTAERTEKTAGDGNALVVCFSRTGEQYTVGVIDKGNTAIVAEMIAEETGADLFELLPADDHYPMTYSELTDVAMREQNENARSEYAGDLPDLAGYDTIFIGAPVWWGDWPMICYTFFENNADALSGKTLVPFSTHEGSGLSGFDKKLAKSCPDSEILKGLAIRGNDCQNKQDDVQKDVAAWLDELGY